MREIHLGATPAMRVRHTGISEVLGECMIGLGAVLTAFAAWRYHVVNRAIERGEIEADPRMVMAVTAIMLIAAAAVIVYMIVSTAAVRSFCGRPMKPENECVTLAQKSLAWHKTTLVQFDSPRAAINIPLCLRFHRLPAIQRLRPVCFGSDLKMRSSPH